MLDRAVARGREPALALAQALDAARPGGTIVLSGLAPMGSSTNLPGARLTREEKTVSGSYYGSTVTSRDFPRFAELWKAGRLPIDRMITRRYRLEEVDRAYRDLLDGPPGRGIITF